jgi:hypothetical protein
VVTDACSGLKFLNRHPVIDHPARIGVMGFLSFKGQPMLTADTPGDCDERHAMQLNSDRLFEDCAFSGYIVGRDQPAHEDSRRELLMFLDGNLGHFHRAGALGARPGGQDWPRGRVNDQKGVTEWQANPSAGTRGSGPE